MGTSRVPRGTARVHHAPPRGDACAAPHHALRMCVVDELGERTVAAAEDLAAATPARRLLWCALAAAAVAAIVAAFWQRAGAT